MMAAAAATALSLGAISAGAQGTQRTAAQNAWCAVHTNQCSPQRDIRHDRSDVVKDLHKVQRNRRAVSANVRDLQADRSMYGTNPTPAQRREMASDRARIANQRASIRSADRGIAADHRDVRRDRWRTDGD